MNYRDENRRITTTNRSNNARKRVMSPQEKAKRDQLLANREKLHKKQEMERGISSKRMPPQKRPSKKTDKFFLEKFHLWAIFLGIIIVVMSVNLLTFVQGIQVKNNENTTSKEIVSWATEDTFSFNGLYLWYKFNHTEIDYPVSIVDAKVSFQNPWTLTLRVTEKEIFGGVILSDSCAYFDQDGMVLLITKTYQEGIRILEGIQVKEAVLYETLVTMDDIGFKNVLEVMGLVEKYQVEVDDIIPSSDSGVSLVIGEIKIQLGLDNYEGKVPHILPILEQLEAKEGTLYLENFDGDNGTITFK